MCWYSYLFLLGMTLIVQPPGPLQLPAANKIEQILTFATDEQDIRLSSVTSLQCYNRPLGDILREIQGKHGICLHVADKWIAELRTTAFTHPMPLHLMLRRLARLHNLTWRVDDTQLVSSSAGIPQRTYILYESDADKRYLRRLQELSWQPLRDRCRQIREYVALSNDRLHELAQAGDQVAITLLNPKTYANAVIAANVTDSLLDILIEQGSVTISYDQLPRDTQTALKEIIVDNYRGRLASVASAREQGYTVPDVPELKPIDSSLIQVFIQGKGMNANLMFQIELDGRSFWSSLPMVRGGEAVVWVRERFEATQREVALKRRAYIRTVGVPIDTQTAKWEDLLRSFSDGCRVNLFSDCFPDQVPTEKLSRALSINIKPTIHLGTALDSYCSAFRRAWWQEGAEGNDIMCLANDWYQRRDRIATDGLIASMKIAMSTPTGLTLDDLATIASLPDSAMARVAAATGIDTTQLEMHRTLLQLYHSLDDVRRKHLTAEGVSLGDLTTSQQDSMMRLAQDLFNQRDNQPIRSLVLRLVIISGQSHFRIIDTGAGGNDRTLRDWTFGRLPRKQNGEKTVRHSTASPK